MPLAGIRRLGRCEMCRGESGTGGEGAIMNMNQGEAQEAGSVPWHPQGVPLHFFLPHPCQGQPFSANWQEVDLFGGAS